VKVDLQKMQSKDVVDLVDDSSSSKGGDRQDDMPTYIIELSKSGRAQCKKCDQLIPNKSVRVGILVDSDWGLLTRWQHLSCTFFHKALQSIECVDGFNTLSEEDQQLVISRFVQSRNEIDDDDIPIDPDAIVRKTWDHAVEPCSEVLLPLLPYQKEGLGWMINQEQGEFHGGILADEMGMGKTIQAIATILHNRPNKKDKMQSKQWSQSDTRHGIVEALPRAGTLIVVPMVAIRQWQLEISRFTQNKSLSVMVYHGNERADSVQEICDHDIVLTTYKVRFPPAFGQLYNC
jgi:DNA repair protein RAD16